MPVLVEQDRPSDFSLEGFGGKTQNTRKAVVFIVYIVYTKVFVNKSGVNQLTFNLNKFTLNTFKKQLLQYIKW